jgi:uncharacterized protein (DUF488 family)
VQDTAILLTIGYQGRTLDEFLRLLRSEGVGALVDVRDVPWSHVRGFSRKPLQEGTEAAGIAYVSATFAGNPKRLRSAAASTEEALRLYAEHLDVSPAILAELEALLAGLHAQGKQPCLVCFERDPAECHRRILAERWRSAGEGRSVRHLRFADVRKR